MLKCAAEKNETIVYAKLTGSNDSFAAAAADNDDDDDDDVTANDWQRRMRELQGAIILASLVEVHMCLNLPLQINAYLMRTYSVFYICF